jgi:hypothetical protein
MDAVSKPDRGVRRLRLLALLFLVLGGLGVAGNHASFPHRTTVAISDLKRDWDGFLVGEFSRPWPFKINKRALDEITAVLPDGTALERFPSRGALALAEAGPGFFVDRPEVVFRLDGATKARPEEALVYLTLPTKTREILYQLPLGIAAALFLLSWRLRPRATLRALWWRPLAVATGSLVVALAGFLGLQVVTGPGVWLALLALFVGPLIAVAALLPVEAEATEGRSRPWEPLVKLAFVLGAIFASGILVEAYLGRVSADLDDRPRAATVKEDWFQLPDDIVELAYARGDVLTLPDAWDHREEPVEGASSAHTWHGALHIFDESGLRRLNGPFPAKDPKTLRIMVVGDSLTYGYGIEEKWTFSRLLERSLQESHRAEVINLGRGSFQSGDILGVLHRFLPQLDPDLVVYAVCLNDFLPSGEGEYTAYAFPLPKDWKRYLLKRTRLARLFDDAYQKLLLALDLRWDFFDDILADQERYQARFAHDVAAMNRMVREAGLPPIMGIVFHQFPGGDLRGWDLVEVAERAMGAAGFNLISVVSWRERFKGRLFPISRWEGHPNELAHSLIAEHLHDRLLAHDKLREYRIFGPEEAKGSYY